MDRKTSTTERISASMHMYITYKANSVIINANTTNQTGDLSVDGSDSTAKYLAAAYG